MMKTLLLSVVVVVAVVVGEALVGVEVRVMLPFYIIKCVCVFLPVLR